MTWRGCPLDKGAPTCHTLQDREKTQGWGLRGKPTNNPIEKQAKMDRKTHLPKETYRWLTSA